MTPVFAWMTRLLLLVWLLRTAVHAQSESDEPVDTEDLASDTRDLELANITITSRTNISMSVCGELELDADGEIMSCSCNVLAEEDIKLTKVEESELGEDEVHAQSESDEPVDTEDIASDLGDDEEDGCLEMGYMGPGVFITRLTVSGTVVLKIMALLDLNKEAVKAAATNPVLHVGTASVVLAVLCEVFENIFELVSMFYESRFIEDLFSMFGTIAYIYLVLAILMVFIRTHDIKEHRFRNLKRMCPCCRPYQLFLIFQTVFSIAVIVPLLTWFVSDKVKGHEYGAVFFEVGMDIILAVAIFFSLVTLALLKEVRHSSGLYLTQVMLMLLSCASAVVFKRSGLGHKQDVSYLVSAIRTLQVLQLEPMLELYFHAVEVVCEQETDKKEQVEGEEAIALAVTKGLSSVDL